MIKKIIQKLLRSSSPKRYQYLYKIIKEIKPKNILEIGVWNGSRAVKMIRCAQEFNKDIKYFGTDLFEEMNDEYLKSELSKLPPTKECVENKIRETGASVTLISGNTLLSLPKHLGELPKMDFIFIDGGHALETIASDWKCSSQLMNDGSVVVFDDYYEDRIDVGAKPIVDSIDRSIYDVKVLPIQDAFKKSDGVLKINFVEVRKR